MSLTEVIYGILFQPVNTFRYLKEAKPLGLSLVIFALVMVLGLIIGQGEASLNAEMTDLGLPASITWMINIIAAVFAFVMLFVMAGFYGLIAEIVYDKNNAKGLLVCMALSFLPALLGSAFSYVFVLASIKWLGTLFSLAAGIWVIVLQVLALREALELTTSGAIIVYLIPLLLMILLLVLLAGIIGAAGYSTFTSSWLLLPFLSSYQVILS